MGIVIYNANSSGIAAAVDAGRRGVKVKLIEPTNHIGGVWAGGLCQTDREVNPVAGGHMRWGILSEMETRFGQKAGSTAGFLYPTIASVNEVFAELLSGVSNNVDVITGKELETVTRDGDTGVITSIRCGGTDYAATNFVEAGDEGDLPYKAGCMMRIGRESVSTSGDSTAGVRPPLTTPALAYNPLTGERRVGVEPRPSQALGTADRRLMAYNERLIVTQDAGRIKWADLAVTANPEDYRADLEVAVAAGYKTIPMSIGRELLPIVGPQTQDGNNGGLVRIGSNWIGQFLDWPTMTWAARTLKRDAYIRRTAGLFKTICTDQEWADRLPELVADTKSWGLVPGLFTNSVIPGMSPYMYVRNCRRMVGQGERVFRDVTAPETNNVLEPTTGYGYAHVDAHWYERYAATDGTIHFEGGSGLDDGEDIVTSVMPFGAMKARYTDARNLMAARAISGTMLGWINVRIELSYVKTGQVCGIAAGVADKAGTYTGDLSYVSDLKPALVAAGAAFKIPGVG